MESLLRSLQRVAFIFLILAVVPAILLRYMQHNGGLVGIKFPFLLHTHSHVAMLGVYRHRYALHTKVVTAQALVSSLIICGKGADKTRIISVRVNAVPKIKIAIINGAPFFLAVIPNEPKRKAVMNPRSTKCRYAMTTPR